METNKKLYDVTVSKGDPHYVVTTVILRYGIAAEEFMGLLKKMA